MARKSIVENNPHMQKAVNDVLELLKDPDSLDMIPRSCIEVPPNAPPSWNWSVMNNLIMHCCGTKDARGYRQWEAMGRTVKKGSWSVQIFAPVFTKVPKKVKNKMGVEETVMINIITGFKAIDVWRYEDTEGQPLPVIDFKPAAPPPLFNVALKWGLDVKWKAKLDDYFGYFSQDKKEIVLASHDWQVFFHELAHAAHAKIDKLNGGQHPEQEVIAEFTAAVLCRMYGVSDGLGNAYQYIQKYSGEMEMGVTDACWKLVAKVEKILKLIFKEEANGAQA